MYLKKEFDPQTNRELQANLAVTPYPKMSPTPICDFCGNFPKFVYAASRMIDGTIRPCWRWCACRNCSQLIEVQSWSGLAMRLIHRMEYLFGHPAETFIPVVDEYLKQFKAYSVKEDVCSGPGLK